MPIDKQRILDLLQEQGSTENADQADSELPDEVDPDTHAELLRKYGLDPEDVRRKARDEAT